MMLLVMKFLILLSVSLFGSFLTPLSSQATQTDSYMDLNFAAGSTVLYEAQVRTANACNPSVGADWQKALCQQKPAPKVVYRAQNMSCGDIANLNQIKLGTLDDMMVDTDDPKHAISLRYIHDRVGANMLWLMPLFPNNDTWNIPDACDNLGSPYAVRDYMHVSGMVSNDCIAKGKDEHDDDAPCWGNDKLDGLITQAGQRGLKVMLDVAFNHFGHNYQMYDYAQYTPIRDRISRKEDLNNLWNFDATYEESLVHPQILDTQSGLESLADKTQLTAFKTKCPDLKGQPLVRGYHMWLNALDWERNQFQCDSNSLEFHDPGFYLGSNSFDPSTHVGDNFTNNWSDVKFLFHHEENAAHQWEFVRNREYLFRVVNYWVSRGVAGFRFDHTTDPNGGMGPNEWKYILSKVDYYAAKRGQSRPIYLAEEFGDQMGMSHVVDVMTDGYVFNMKGSNGATKDAAFVQGVLSNNNRFNGHTYVMTALETHDEQRLVSSNTGFDMWTGAGFWGIGATTWSTPMILMGQEFGEKWGLGFRKSDFLRSRFEGTDNYIGDASFYKLIDYYGSMIHARLDNTNRALLSSHYYFLPRQDNPSLSPDPRIYAAAKWSDDGNVVFVFHNLWPVDAAQTYFIPPDVASQMAISDSNNYKLVDVFTGKQAGDCHTGAALKFGLPVILSASTRVQWLRLQLCN